MNGQRGIRLVLTLPFPFFHAAAKEFEGLPFYQNELNLKSVEPLIRNQT
jgi:hypothetical protein